MEIIKEWKSFGGRQLVVRHQSTACACPMDLGLFLPPGDGPHPVLFYLSGLTCNWENATTKAGFQKLAAELGIAVVTPDTSPKGEGIADAEDRWDLGTGAGFYVNATSEPWAANYQMYDYVTEELPKLLGEFAELDVSRASVTGHSMGGHGALVLGLREPQLFRSVSAFSPIVAPSQVQWGQDAFGAYLADESEWAAYDATLLVANHARPDTILIDQGLADGFLENQLKTSVFVDACKSAGQQVNARMREGYDHSYYFIASFMEEHMRFHAEALGS